MRDNIVPKRTRSSNFRMRWFIINIGSWRQICIIYFFSLATSASAAWCINFIPFFFDSSSFVVWVIITLNVSFVTLSQSDYGWGFEITKDGCNLANNNGKDLNKAVLPFMFTISISPNITQVYQMHFMCCIHYLTKCNVTVLTYF